jgi:restriction system protein
MKMARRNKNGEALEGVVHLVALLPWWLGVALAVASYLWLHSVAVSPMPAATDPKQLNALIAGSVWRAVALIGQYLVPLLCLAGAGVSIFERRKASQLHSDAVNRDDGIAQMSWREFEVLVGEHFRQLGFSVTVTGGGGPDGGVDVLLRKGADRYLVQCKHWRARRVGVEAVRELYGVMAAQRMAGGFVVTSGDFTEEARAFASGREVQLINGLALQQAVRAQSAATSLLNPQATLGGRRALRESSTVAVAPVTRTQRPTNSAATLCPVCASSMVLRQARNGSNAGQNFWGCSQFGKTQCRGSRPVE